MAKPFKGNYRFLRKLWWPGRIPTGGPSGLGPSTYVAIKNIGFHGMARHLSMTWKQSGFRPKGSGGRSVYFNDNSKNSKFQTKKILFYTGPDPFYLIALGQTRAAISRASCGSGPGSSGHFEPAAAPGQARATISRQQRLRARLDVANVGRCGVFEPARAELGSSQALKPLKPRKL